MLSESSTAHRCFAVQPPGRPTESFQSDYCLLTNHTGCKFFVGAQKQADERVLAAQRARRRTSRSAVLTATLLTLAAVAVLALFVFNNRHALFPNPRLPQVVAVALETEISTPTPSLTATPTPGGAGAPANAAATSTALALTTALASAATPAPAAAAPTTAASTAAAAAPPATEPSLHLPTPTPTNAAEGGQTIDVNNPTVPGARQVQLSPTNGNAGWWQSSDTLQTGLGDSFLYAGDSDQQRYISAMQFDLSNIARGAPLLSGELRLTGLRDDHLDRTKDRIWLVQLVPQSELGKLAGASFMAVFSAGAPVTLFPEIHTAELAPGRTNTWKLDEATLGWLEKRIAEGDKSLIVRIVSSTQGADNNLFAWDSGLGAKSEGNPPVLALAVGPAPATPPPLPTKDYVVATFTPIPENALTAVAQQQTATAVAQTTGTYTPMPPFVTPTPFPKNLPTVQANALLQQKAAVVLETPTPGNAATATANANYATAVAVTTGTYTPVPTEYVTPFIVYPSPPPGNAATEVARGATAQAEMVVARPTETPLPYNAVVGEYVIATPTPMNVATAAALVYAATASAQTNGPATATPWNWIVITPTPVPLPTATPTLPVVIAAQDLTATPTATPTEVAPKSLPPEYANKIFFKTTRSGLEETYMYDPTNENLGKVTRSWVYPMAYRNIAISPDGKKAAVVHKDDKGVFQIYIRSLEYNTEKQLTPFSRSSYDPAWSPKGEWIAFVTSEPGNDEVYRVTPDGATFQRLTNNTFEWDKHPTWSPDGSQIVWFSNRGSGQRQLWIMNADGSNQKPLLNDEFENYDPVWTR